MSVCDWAGRESTVTKVRLLPFFFFFFFLLSEDLRKLLQTGNLDAVFVLHNLA